LSFPNVKAALQRMVIFTAEWNTEGTVFSNAEKNFLHVHMCRKCDD